VFFESQALNQLALVTGDGTIFVYSLEVDQLQESIKTKVLLKHKIKINGSIKKRNKNKIYKKKC
jgi:hypothetical protein